MELASCPQASTMSSCIDSVQLHLHTPKLSVSTLQPPQHFSLQPNHTPPTPSFRTKSARGMIQLLPQELIDHTIDLSVSHGVEHLKVLSVVSRAWRARSQFHILGKRCTLHLGHLFDIYSGISKSTGAAAPQEKITIPFSYVRRLNLDGVSIFPRWGGVHLEALQLFTNVTDLRIHSWDFELFESSLIRTAFEHVGRTVTTLEISHCVVNLTVLIFLMSLFPYVNDFRYEARPIHSYGGQPREFKIQDSESLSSSVKSPGKLAFLDAQKNCFLAFVSEECLDAHSITLGSEMPFTEGMQELFCRPKASELTLVCIGTFVKDSKFIHIYHLMSIHHSSHNRAPRHCLPFILHSTPNPDDPPSTWLGIVW